MLVFVCLYFVCCCCCFFFFIVWFFVAHTVQFKVTSTNIIVFSKNLHFLIYLYNVQFMFCLLRLALSISHRFDKDSFLLIFEWGVFAHLGIITCLFVCLTLSRGTKRHMSSIIHRQISASTC